MGVRNKVTTSQETIPGYSSIGEFQPLSHSYHQQWLLTLFSHLCTGHGLAAMLHFLAPFGADWKILFMQPMHLENYHIQSE